jgi:hypothetical protein
MKHDFLKISIALLLAVFFIWTDLDPFNHGLMHMINFPIHEVGHLIFMPFGEFIYIAGGSIFQILLPVFFAIYFFRRKEFFSSALVLIWVGNNFFDVAVYASDAVFMELPLWSLTGNEATTIHDWNYLLTKTNLLPHTNLVASTIKGIGILITIVGIFGAFYFARKTPPSEN